MTNGAPSGAEIKSLVEPGGAELKALAGSSRNLAGRVRTIEQLREAGMGARALGRLTGTDIRDPLAGPRLGTTLTGGIGGSIAGARAGAAIPGPLKVPATVVGGIVGGVAGTVAGTVAPEATLEFLEGIGSLPEGTRRKTGLINEELQYIAETEAMIDLALGSAMQAAALGGRAVSRTLSGIKRADRPGAEAAAREGIELPAAAVGGSAFARFFTATLGRFPYTAGPLRKAGQKAETQVELAIRGLPERFAPLFTESEIGKQIFSRAKRLVRVTAARFDREYIKLFDEAASNNIAVTPKGTLGKADEILSKISLESPTEFAVIDGKTVRRKQKPGKALSKVQEFIKNDVLSLRGEIEGTTALSKQTLREMDGLISKLDQELASLDPGEAKFARALMLQLRTAMKADVVQNISDPAFGQRLAKLDAEFSNTMSHLFETTAAKRFGQVTERGLRTRDFATTTPIDGLFRIVVDANSPQVVEELSRIVGRRTMRRITARYLENGLERGFKATAEGVQFDPRQAKKAFGLDKRRSSRAEVTDRLIRIASGGAADINVLNATLGAAEKLAGIEIPNVSQFVARSAVLGGVRRFVRLLIPGAAIVATGAGGVAGGGFGALLAMGTFVFGSRSIAKLLSNPDSARALTIVGSKTATLAAKKTAYLRGMRAIVQTAADEDLVPREMVGEIIDGVRDSILSVLQPPEKN